VRILVAVFVLLAGTVAAGRPARSATRVVDIGNNYFLPRELRVDPGDTVMWKAGENGHTVTADDASFDFYPVRTLNRGETVQWTFLTEGRFAYHCRVHGPAGMTGEIAVGGPAPTPAPTPVPEERTVPSPAYPTISAAVTGAPPGAVVNVLSGIYRESVHVTAPGITIRGGDGVVVDGVGRRVGISVAADGVRIEGLTVRGFAESGVIFLGVRGFTVERVVAGPNGLTDIAVTGSSRGALSDVEVTGAARAGVLVDTCRDCDVVVDGLRAYGNHAGIVVSNAEGIVLRHSDIRDNATGIVLKTTTGTSAPQRGAHVFGNEIHDNANADAPRPPAGTPPDFSTGAGVWIAGGWQDVVERNSITGGDYGVLVSGPATDDRIVGNAVAGASKADLAWDGIGANVCFSQNSAGSTEPPLAQTLYSCDLPATAGVPDPVVLADLALRAAEGVL
jgi:plastocyanin/nitrous oxidase accessory protein NosD